MSGSLRTVTLLQLLLVPLAVALAVHPEQIRLFLKGAENQVFSRSMAFSCLSWASVLGAARRGKAF